ncbi:MAG: hypothetical protein J5601_04805 [Elusimicrobiaceae bacterium]|nr:hypothetical protein [Elusimicrobiaceae bacterium]
MKKLYCLLLSATFVLIGLAPTYAKVTTSQVKSGIARKLQEQAKYYMFDRVKTMCEEWPECKEWAMDHHKKNPSFYIIDAEVEYYVDKNSEWPYWQHNFYVKAIENLQEQAYVFKTKINRKSKNHYSFPATPQEIAKFPGHPFTNMPSEHAKCVIDNWGVGPVDLPKDNKLRKRWAKSKMDNSWLQVKSAIEQQRVLWDEKDNPLWVRRLDWTPWFLNALLFPKGALIARQNKLGEPFKYIDADKTTSVLQEADRQPEFALIIRH